MESKNEMQMSLSSLYDYVFSNKAQIEISPHLSTKRENKSVLLKQCDLILTSVSPLDEVLPDLTKPTYILAPEGLYYLEELNKPISEEHFIKESKGKINELWGKLGGNIIPFNKTSQALSPKYQRIITNHTRHAPENTQDGPVVVSTKSKKVTPEEIQAKIKVDKENEKQQKINDFAMILSDEKSSQNFRLVLRALKSTHLELLLFGNIEDPISDVTYNIPTEDEISKLFYKLEDGTSQVSGHHLFMYKRNKALEQFTVFFMTCKIIADFYEKNNDAQNSVAAEHAYKMLVLFGYNEKGNPFNFVESYFKTHQCYQQLKPIHDTLVPYSLPKSVSSSVINTNLAGWQAFIQEFGKNALSYFQQAEPVTIGLGRAPTNIHEVKQVLAKWKYKAYEQYPKLADICVEYKVSEDDFNKCIEIEKMRKTSDNLPDIRIDGKSVGHNGYYLVKLPVDDPRAYILGHVTHCCQYIGGHSEACVIDGITRENNGFYVLLKQNKPSDIKSSPLPNHSINYADFSIIGQGYAWLSQAGNLVFDSWENIRKEDNPIVVDLLKEFGRQVTEQSDVVRVTIGHGGNTPKEFKTKDLKINAAEIMREGSQYQDSSVQLLVYLNTEKQEKIINNLLEKQKDCYPLFWKNEHDFKEIIGIQEFYSTQQAQYITILLLESDSEQLWKQIIGEVGLRTFQYIIPNQKFDLIEQLAQLHLKSDLNRDSFQMLIKQNREVQTVNEVLNAFDESRLLNSNNFQELVKNETISILANGFIALHNAGLLNESNFQKILVVKNKKSFNESLILLQGAGLLNDSNFHTLTTYNNSNDNTVETFKACLIVLAGANLLDESNFKMLTNSQNIETIYALNDGLGALDEAKILNFDNFHSLLKLLKKDKHYAYCLQYIAEAKVLNDFHYQLLVAMAPCIRAMDFFEESLESMKKADILNSTNYQLLLLHVHTDKLYNFARAKSLNEEVFKNLLLDDNDDNELTPNEVLNTCKAILTLNKAGLTTAENHQLLLDNAQYSEHIFTVLTNLHGIGMLDEDNFKGLLDNPMYAETIASRFEVHHNEIQRIVCLINTIVKDKSPTFFSNQETGSFKEIGMLTDLIRTIISPSEEELSDIIDNFKEEERYKEVLDGRFGGGILMLLDDLKTHKIDALVMK